MRHQPDGYVRSFIDNKLVTDIEDDVVNDQLTFNVKCKFLEKYIFWHQICARKDCNLSMASQNLKQK